MLRRIAAWFARLPRLARGAIAVLLLVAGAALGHLIYFLDVFDVCLGKPNCDANHFGDEPWFIPFYALALLLLGLAAVLATFRPRR